MKFKGLIVYLLLLVAVNCNQLREMQEQTKSVTSIFGDVGCFGCKAVIWTLSTLILNPTGIKFFESVTYLGCSLFLFSRDQCQIISDAYVGMVMENLAIKTFEPNYFCEILLPVCKPNNYELLSTESYTRRILSDKPDFIKDNNYINNLYKEIEDDRKAGRERETMLMYHFSDLHWNLEYHEGTNNDCGAIVCCTPNSPQPKTEAQKAGKWGDYNCDANPKVFQQLKYSINMTGEPDFIIWTGDNPDHSISKDPRVTTNATIQITKFVEDHSPKSVIFPIHGKTTHLIRF